MKTQDTLVNAVENAEADEEINDGVNSYNSVIGTCENCKHAKDVAVEFAEVEVRVGTHEGRQGDGSRRQGNGSLRLDVRPQAGWLTNPNVEPCKHYLRIVLARGLTGGLLSACP